MGIHRPGPGANIFRLSFAAAGCNVVWTWVLQWAIEIETYADGDGRTGLLIIPAIFVLAMALTYTVRAFRILIIYRREHGRFPLSRAGWVPVGFLNLVTLGAMLWVTVIEPMVWWTALCVFPISGAGVLMGCKSVDQDLAFAREAPL